VRVGGECVYLVNYNWPVRVRELDGRDASSVVALWTDAGLTRPWNDAAKDYQRALDGMTSAVLGLEQDGELIGTVMVGHDGHRGWVYYLAVARTHQREGIGSDLMRAAEEWLRRVGAVKIQLMVRSENDSALKFYDRIGFETSDVKVLSRWLTD
jgi:ribosomal protein S18 acetylase RimI-like enzyme